MLARVTPTEPASTAITVLGIDAAAEPRNVGLARGVVEKIAAWTRPPTLLAIDAPLGWPRALSACLRSTARASRCRPPRTTCFAGGPTARSTACKD